MSSPVTQLLKKHLRDYIGPSVAMSSIDPSVATFELKPEDSNDTFERWDDSLRNTLASEDLLEHILVDKKASEPPQAIDGTPHQKRDPLEELLDWWGQGDIVTWEMVAERLDPEIRPTYSDNQTAYDLYSWIERAWSENLEVRYETLLNSLLDLQLGKGTDCIQIYCKDFCRLLKHFKTAEQALQQRCKGPEKGRYYTGEGFFEALFIRGTARHKYLEGWRRNFARRDDQIQPVYVLAQTLLDSALYFVEDSD